MTQSLCKLCFLFHLRVSILHFPYTVRFVLATQFFHVLLKDTCVGD